MILADLLDGFEAQQAWRDQAACRMPWPKWEQWVGIQPIDKDELRKVCADCPVRVPCGDDAKRGAKYQTTRIGEAGIVRAGLAPTSLHRQFTCPRCRKPRPSYWFKPLPKKDALRQYKQPCDHCRGLV